MSEFQRTPESMRAEITELDKGIAEATRKYSELEDGIWKNTGITETADAIQAEAKNLKINVYNILVALKDTGEIRQRLAEYVELYIEGEMEPDLGAIMLEVFGIDETYAVEPEVVEVINSIKDEYDLPQE